MLVRVTMSHIVLHLFGLLSAFHVYSQDIMFTLTSVLEFWRNSFNLPGALVAEVRHHADRAGFIRPCNRHSAKLSEYQALLLLDNAILALGGVEARATGWLSNFNQDPRCAKKHDDLDLNILDYYRRRLVALDELCRKFPGSAMC